MKNLRIVVVVICLLSTIFGQAQTSMKTPIGTFEVEAVKTRDSMGGMYSLKLDGNQIFRIIARTKTPVGKFGEGTYQFLPQDRSYSVTYNVKGGYDDGKMKVHLMEGFSKLYEAHKDKLNRDILAVQTGDKLELSGSVFGHHISCDPKDIMKFMAMDATLLRFPKELPLMRDVSSKLGTFSANSTFESLDYELWREKAYSTPMPFILKTTFERLKAEGNHLDPMVDLYANGNATINFDIKEGMSFMPSSHYISFETKGNQVMLLSVDDEIYAFDPNKVKALLHKYQTYGDKQTDFAKLYDIIYDLLWDDLQQAFKEYPNHQKEINFLAGGVIIYENGKLFKSIFSEKGKDFKSTKQAEEKKAKEIKRHTLSKKYFDKKKKWLADLPKIKPEFRVDGMGYITRSKYHTKPDTTLWYGGIIKREMTEDNKKQFYRSPSGLYNDKKGGVIKMIHGTGKIQLHKNGASMYDDLKHVRQKIVFEGLYEYGYKNGKGISQYYEGGKLLQTTKATWIVDELHGDCIIETHQEDIIEKGKMEHGFRKGTWTVENTKTGKTSTIIYDEYGVDKNAKPKPASTSSVRKTPMTAMAAMIKDNEEGKQSENKSEPKKELAEGKVETSVSTKPSIQKKEEGSKAEKVVPNEPGKSKEIKKEPTKKVRAPEDQYMFQYMGKKINDPVLEKLLKKGNLEIKKKHTDEVVYSIKDDNSNEIEVWFCCKGKKLPVARITLTYNSGTFFNGEVELPDDIQWKTSKENLKDWKDVDGEFLHKQYAQKRNVRMYLNDEGQGVKMEIW